MASLKTHLKWPAYEIDRTKQYLTSLFYKREEKERVGEDRFWLVPHPSKMPYSFKDVPLELVVNKVAHDLTNPMNGLGRCEDVLREVMACVPEKLPITRTPLPAL